MSGHTVTITANSDQDTVDNLLEMDGDYWTATTNEGITQESTGYELEITLDTTQCFGGFSMCACVRMCVCVACFSRV